VRGFMNKIFITIYITIFIIGVTSTIYSLNEAEKNYLEKKEDLFVQKEISRFLNIRLIVKQKNMDSGKKLEIGTINDDYYIKNYNNKGYFFVQDINQYNPSIQIKICNKVNKYKKLNMKCNYKLFNKDKPENIYVMLN
tara:strand:+ start:242 stop:655 length:414 start_codon:yes stop_codon:yes gene_type:complete